MKVILIDDEAKARRILENLLKEYCPQMQVVATAEDVPSAVKVIHKHQPDLIFLDIEMPGYTGFQLLDFFDKINFDIIFTTAYEEYAIQAFQVSAVDYLLKPIQIDLLIKAVEKASQKQDKQLQERFDTLQKNFQQPSIQRIALPVAEGLMFVEVEDIICMTADGAYTEIHWGNKQKVLVSKNIKSFEKILQQNTCFFRTHRSHLINLNRVKQYVKQEGGYIVMDNEKVVNLARDRKENFLKVYQMPR